MLLAKSADANGKEESLLDHSLAVARLSRKLFARLPSPLKEQEGLEADLEAAAGFLHVDRSGKPSLVLDLIEEFRQPVVDRAVFSWLNKGGQLNLQKGLLDGASRESVASRVLLRLTSLETHRGKQYQVRSIVQMQARLAASAVRGLRPYRSFSFKW
jgi:CRISPR-associated protein Cas1